MNNYRFRIQNGEVRTMQLFKAIYAFWRTLFACECEHKRVTSMPGQPAMASYCPDCGYRVVMVWTLCRCRTCGSKRNPKKSIDGHVAPLYRYCRQCGEAEYQIIKKSKINVYEMPYAILCKEIDYAEQRLGSPSRPGFNPFESPPGAKIVDGEVIRKREFTGHQAKA